MKKNLIYLTILLSIGCSTTKKVVVENVASESVTATNPLEGTWILKNVLMGDAMDAPCGFSNEGTVKEMNVTFTSEKINGTEQRKVYGQSSVNSFSGNYSIQSYDAKTKIGKISFGPIASTKMASVNPDFMGCENRYLSYLEKSVDFKVEDGKLQLSLTTPITGNSDSPWGETYKNVLYFDKK